MRTGIVILLLAALALAYYRYESGYRSNLVPAQIQAEIAAEIPATVQTPLEAQRAAAVQEAFVHAWTGYKQYAFPHDELHPVSNGYGDSRNGWGASAVDAFSTALIMDLPEIVDEILAYIPTINFTYTATDVSLFETTIRYLAGMLSGYDLLTGPLSHLANDTAHVAALLTQSVSLADTLKFAFNTSTGIPRNYLNINAQVPTSGAISGLASIGTLVLEWTHLSDLTGDPQYADLAQKAESYLLDPQPGWAEPWPGLVGTKVNIDTGQFLDASGGWDGEDDSFYEYLIKMYVYDQSRFGHYRDRWIEAAASSIQHLASHPSTDSKLTFMAAFSHETLSLKSGHLACFDGGTFILGGAVLNATEFVDFGLALTEGCHKTYNSTATQIGPEAFSWSSGNVPTGQAAFFEQNGFYVTRANYDLRPEVIESYYYAYRQTRDPKYQDWAWDAFVAINATTRTPSGFSSISDVTVPGGGSKSDNQESFLFAEVMKYSYLIHAPDAEYQVLNGGKNDYVFNTECHPLKVAGTPI